MTGTRSYESQGTDRRCAQRAAWRAALVVVALACAAGARAQAPANPTEGGPFGSLPTFVCTSLAGAYCHQPTGPDPLSSVASVTPYLDNTARNWGCRAAGFAQPALSLGGGSWSKSFGTESDTASGCGVAYWNHARQAALFVPKSDRGANVAAASQGATVSVSSTFNSGTPAHSLIDGNRRGSVWGSGGGWSSLQNPTATSPQWIQVNLNRTRRINEIVVTTLQDNYNAPIEPNVTTTFTTYGIRNFNVLYWSGSAWVGVASVASNNRVLRRFAFSPVDTTAIRVTITAALQNYARVVEVEAYEPATTSAKVSDRYTSLQGPAGVLGLPISNPVPYGWAGATYQQFASGVITFVRGQSDAHAVGGTTPEDQALAEKFASVFGISPRNGPAIYGLAGPVGCTNGFGSGCDGGTGRYARWRDAYQGADEMIVARTGWTDAMHLAAPVLAAWTGRYGAHAWNGDLGFPITDLLPTGSDTQHQEFEAGSILWERSACASGAYRARIVPQFRRPIADSNLTMLCDSEAPVNRTLALPSERVPFQVDGDSGDYRFISASESGWYTGARVRFESGGTFEVNDPFYSGWIGGAGGDGSVADALAGRAPASDWGPPTGNATCADEPCTMMLQRFAHGLATTRPGGFLDWAPTGVDAPIGFGGLERGYTTPPPPEDPRESVGVPRSGDFITLVWMNKASAENVTTTLFRSVTPLNGPTGPWTDIKSYPPPTLPKGTFTEYTDLGPANNARNCYYVVVSDGFNSATTPTACIHTLDGTTVAGVNRSIPRGVSRAQLKVAVPSLPDDSATLGPVMARLEGFSKPSAYNFTYLDSPSGTKDFTLASTRTYDLLLTGIEDVSDIVGITLTSERLRIHGDNPNDNLRVSQIQLLLDNVLVFSKTFDPPHLISNSSAPGGTSLKIGFNELRSHPRWKDIYAVNPNAFLGFTREDFASRLDSALATSVFTVPGAAYHGSRLRDGFQTTLSKPAGYQADRLHVRQHLTADLPLGIFCSIDYDLRLKAFDIDGNPVPALENTPAPGTIFKTTINVENPDADCGTTFMRKLLYTIFSTSEFYPFAMSRLNDDLEVALRAQGPSQVQSAPPGNAFFCFPGTNEGVPAFRNGGLSICFE